MNAENALTDLSGFVVAELLGGDVFSGPRALRG
jgi:hypothetical protein